MKFGLIFKKIIKFCLPYGVVIFLNKLIFFYTKINRKRINQRLITVYCASTEIRKLQLGCGTNILDGWLNIDLFGFDKRIVILDVREKFPFKDNLFDYIFCEHLIEHLDYQEGLCMLNECIRVLKPKGKIRISTPCMDFLVELYNKDKSDLQQRYINFQASRWNLGDATDTFVINNFFYSWGHRFIYDYKTLKKALLVVGFVDVVRCEPGISEDVNLSNLEYHGKVLPDRFNAMESLVLEAVKPATI